MYTTMVKYSSGLSFVTPDVRKDMGVWEEATRLLYAATANGREVACCLTQCLVRTGAGPKLFGGGIGAQHY